MLGTALSCSPGLLRATPFGKGGNGGTEGLSNQQASGAAGMRTWEIDFQSLARAAAFADGQLRSFPLQPAQIHMHPTGDFEDRGLRTRTPCTKSHTGPACHSPQRQYLRPCCCPDFALKPGSGRQAAGRGGPCPNLERSFHGKGANEAGSSAAPPSLPLGLPAGLASVPCNMVPSQGPARESNEVMCRDHTDCA